MPVAQKSNVTSTNTHVPVLFNGVESATSASTILFKEIKENLNLLMKELLEHRKSLEAVELLASASGQCQRSERSVSRQTAVQGQEDQDCGVAQLSAQEDGASAKWRSVIAVALVLALRGKSRARRTKATGRPGRSSNAGHIAEHEESTLAYVTAEPDESTFACCVTDCVVAILCSL